MIKRIGVFLLATILCLSSSMTALACDENQTNTYVSQILFGDNALSYESDEDVEKLLCALYICSEQSNMDGQDELDLLKEAKVRRVPSLSNININGSKIFDCSHNSWEHVSKDIKKVQSCRKDVLRKTVVNVFDFGMFNELFKSDSGQIDSFSALLYYSHILADYLGDNPTNTEVSAKGYDIPAYSGKPAIELKGNVPNFTSKQKKETESYKEFSDLDGQGRCGVAIANIGPDTLAPANSRQKIGNIKPSGWNQDKYEGIVNSEPPYIYNRCHLIAHQLANVDDEENLITGTRYLNEAMIPYEERVAAYVKETGNHVLYRATPVFVGDNDVASGVQLEAYSVEDKGKGIRFNVYLYNVQPGVDINYANGKSEKSDTTHRVENIIPFATVNPSDSNPDLIYEMVKHLEVLFKEQVKTNSYKTMMDEINRIANEARNVGNQGEKEYQCYLKLKEYQYEFMNILTIYIPLLLEKEDFFKSAFK